MGGGRVTIRVGIDVAPLQLTGAGTARYVEGLACALERRVDVEVERLTWGGPSRLTAAVRDVVWYPALLPIAARRLQVLHCTTFRAPLRAPVPVIATVHDLAIVRFPEYFTAWTRLYGRTFLRRVLRAADRVIAVSEFTKRDVVELAGVAPERVHVVPNSTSEVFTPEGPRSDGDYVLAVGTLEPRKNLPRLAEAARRLGVELRVVGASGWGNVEVGGDGVRWRGRLADDELAREYRGALCLAYPSLYEGFGIPVLEAMRCGTPVVTSAGSAMEEVAAGAAELVDPLDPSAIAAGIERAIARRDELRSLGLERAGAFTWEAAADRTAAVYREVA
jgi:glycosyltransferase involved in cell wall biosynthesis